MGTLVPSLLPGRMSFNSHNHPGAFKEAGAQRGPGHRADLSNYSNSGLSPKPGHAFLIPMTKAPNERAKDTGRHHMNCRAKSSSAMCPSSVRGQWKHMWPRTPSPCPQRSHSLLEENKSPLPAARPLLQLPERQATLAELPTCLASLCLTAKAPAREETAAPQLPSCGNPGLPQLPQDKPNPKPGIFSQGSNFIYKTCLWT